MPTLAPFVASSETSRAAAASLSPETRERQAQLILRHLTSSGGATDKEMEIALGLTHEAVSARRNALVAKGLVVNSGFTKMNPGTGRIAVVWVLTGTTLAADPDLTPAVPRPTKAELRRSVAELGLVGDPSEELQKTITWLTHLSTKP